MMDELPDTPSDLVFRAGAMADWPAIAQIVAETWEDGDYIDEALWAEWVSDSEGHLIVVTRDNRVVALSKLTELSPAEWWLEGGRVDPTLRGQGIGRAMTEYILTYFRKHCHGLLRAATYSENEASIKLFRGAGFRHIGSYAKVEASARETDIRGFRRLVPANQSMTFKYLRNSPMYRANHFVENQWVMYYLTDARLGQYLADPHIYVLGWQQDYRLRGVAILFTGPSLREEMDEDTLHLGYVDAPDDTTLLAMLEGLRGIAAKRGQGKLVWKMPTGVGLERALLGVDIERVWEDDGALWLFELPMRRLGG